MRTFSPKTNVEYADQVRLAFQREVDQEAFGRGVPLAMSVVFRFPRPKGHFGTGRNADKLKPSAPAHHTTKPDMDNLLKLIKDGLKGYAWHDDSQIVRYDRVEKLYCDDAPRTEVTIYPAEDHGSSGPNSDAPVAQSIW